MTAVPGMGIASVAGKIVSVGGGASLTWHRLGCRWVRGRCCLQRQTTETNRPIRVLDRELILICKQRATRNEH